MHTTEEDRAGDSRRRPRWITLVVILYAFLAFYYFISMSGGILGFESRYMAFESIALCIICILLAYGLWTLRTFAWYLWVIFHGLYAIRAAILVPTIYYFYGSTIGAAMVADLGFKIVAAMISLLIVRYACRANIRRLFRIRVDSRRPALVALGVSIVLAVVSFFGTTQPPPQPRSLVHRKYTIDDSQMLQSWEEFSFEMSEREFETALGDFLDSTTVRPGSPITTFHIFHGDTVEHAWDFRDSSMVEYTVVYSLGDESTAEERLKTMFRKYRRTYGPECASDAESKSWEVGNLKMRVAWDGSEIAVGWRPVPPR